MSGVFFRLPVFVVGMEICWLYAGVALFSMLFGNGGPALSFPLVALLFVFGYLVAYVLEHLDLSVGTLRAIGAAAAAIIILNLVSLQVTGVPSLQGIGWLFGTSNPEIDLTGYRREVILAMGFGVLLWWRAVKLTQRRNSTGAVLFSIRLGVGVIALEALLEPAVVPWEAASWIVIPFFVFSLWTLVLAREEESGGGSQGNGLAIAASAVVILVVAGLTIGWLPYGILGGPTSKAGNVLSDILNVVLSIVLFPLILLTEALVFILRALFSNANSRVFDIFNNLPQSPIDAVQDLVRDGSLIPPIVGTLIKLGILAALVFLVLFWLSRALRKRRSAQEEELREERESLWAEGDLAGDLKELILGFLGHRKERGQGSLWYGAERDRGARSSILRVYYALLNLSSSRGAARSLSQSPYEYLDTLYLLYPINRVEADTITVAFTKYRYSPHEPGQNEVSRVQEAWQRLQKPDEGEQR
ncbi:MAG: DUF4129 domain-containing protein [Dehalococcoidia bacterium]|nr:DUF4129 domain-containing protein [Dehalococcoidia bacterium]